LFCCEGYTVNFFIIICVKKLSNGQYIYTSVLIESILLSPDPKPVLYNVTLWGSLYVCRHWICGVRQLINHLSPNGRHGSLLGGDLGGHWFYVGFNYPRFIGGACVLCAAIPGTCWTV